MVTSVSPTACATVAFGLTLGSLISANASGARSTGIAADRRIFFMRLLLNKGFNAEFWTSSYPPTGPGGNRPKDDLKRQPECQDLGAPDEVVPEVADVGGEIKRDHGRLGGEGRQEDRRPAHPLHEKSGQEDPQDGAVEQRAQDVDRLDQVLHEIGGKGEADGDNSKERRKDPGVDQVMALWIAGPVP